MTAKANVLVIDDDEIMLQVIQDLLEDHGYRVVTMASPIGATRTIVKEDIHLVVVDWRMPIMQGDRLVGLLRSWERVRELPVILISGTSRESLERAAADLQGVSIVTKSSMDADLPAAVKSGLPSSPPEPDSKRRISLRTGDGVESFYDRLTKRLQEATQLWTQINRGARRHRELDFLVNTVHGQAQLLGLSDMARLIEEIHGVLRRVADGANPSSQIQDAVTRALSVAATMPKLTNEGVQVDVEPSIQRLREAVATLRD